MNIKDTYLGFTDNLKPMQKVRAEKTLDNLIRYNGNIITNKEFILIKLQEGLIPCIEEDYSYYSRKLQGNTKSKTDYRLKDQNGSFYHITKTEYNYALYLLENNFLNEQKVKEFIVAENNRLLQVAQDEFNHKQREKERKETLEKEKQEFDNWLIEQVNNYNKNEKLDIAKSIFLDTQGQYNELMLCKFLVLIENIENQMCKDMLKSWLHTHNTISKKVFYHITGIKLPSTDKGTMPLLDSLSTADYQGIIPYTKKQSKVKKEVTTDTFYKLIRKPEPHYEEVIGIPISKYGLDIFITQYSDGTYQLSEAKSGMLMTDADTKKKLMDKLKDIVNLHGVEKINRMIQEQIDNGGIGISLKYRDVV